MTMLHDALSFSMANLLRIKEKNIRLQANFAQTVFGILVARKHVFINCNWRFTRV